MRRRIIWMTIPLLLLLLPAASVYANAAPPPPHIWFVFSYETQPAPTLLGLQLAGCTTSACTQRTLLHQYGTCTLEGCLPTPAIPTSARFECAQNRCLVSTSNPATWQSERFVLIAAFADRVRLSEPFELSTRYGVTLNVAVRADDLGLTPLPYSDGATDAMTRSATLAAFLTLLIEPVLALAVLALLRVDRATLLRTLPGVALVNLLSLPVVWLFFPSLGAFQPDAARGFGQIILAGSLFYGAASVGIAHAPARWRVATLVLTLVTIPCIYGFALIAAFGLSYGRYLPSQLDGLPIMTTTILSQVFAVVFETLVLWGLLRSRLTLRRIAWITLVANLASFAVGWLVLPVAIG